jgi:hypothetical protein
MSILRGISTLCLIALLTGSSSGQDELPYRYHRYQGVLDTLANLQSLFPSILYLDTMGYSTRDSIPMLRLKISDNPRIDEDEPAVLFCGGAHADEVLGTEVTFHLVQDITFRWADGDTEIVKYVDNLEIFVVPFVNPEGRMVVEGGDLDWRKNKSDNDTNDVFDNFDGVDNNRNYDIGWEYLNNDNSNNPAHLMFRGYAPFTESENIAMREFGYKYKPVIAVDYHSPTYGRAEVVYFPWYWSGHGGNCPDFSLIEYIAEEFAYRIRKIHGYGNYDCIYGFVNKGDFKNFFYGHYGTIPMTVEISDTTIEDPELVDRIVAAHIPGQYYLLSRALGPGITGVIRDSLTLEPLEAEVEVVEFNGDEIFPRLSRADNGRYRRLLPSRSYSLRFLKEGYRTKSFTGIPVWPAGYSHLDVLLAPENPCPSAPELIYPQNRQTIYDQHITFLWAESDSCECFMLEVALDRDFNHYIICDSAIVDRGYRAMLPLAGTSYYWRVKAYNQYGWGPYSPILRFFVDLNSDIDDYDVLPDKFIILQNYPNPFNSQTCFKFFVPAEAPAKIMIYDISGALVATLADRNYEKGWHGLHWNGKTGDGGQVSSGIYFFSLRSNDTAITRRFTILK